MSITSEFAIRMENRPGALGRVCGALAERGINIAALQSIPSQDTTLVCVVPDDPAAAASALDKAGILFAEMEVLQVRITNRPGELARVASRLGEAGININYAYSGFETGTNAPLMIFGVTDLGRAAAILDQTAAST
jgi:hypothetical protein